MSSAFIVGDIHGEWLLADSRYNEMKGRLGAPDLLIQVGDYGYYPCDGINPHTGEKDPYHFPNDLSLWDREFDHPCMFIDGNHEDHEALREEMAKGSPVLLKGDRSVWEYLPRGTCRDGVLYVGGASSVDKERRLRWGHHWSELENLTREEVTPILEANHEDVKVVISHTSPSSWDMSPACNPAWGGENKEEINRVFLQQILEKYQPEYWFFGHWHKAMTGIHTFEDGSECKWQCLDICEHIYFEFD